jgi:hypothetical protein
VTEKLVVLDFSGTLCLAAPRFAEPKTLERELRSSGLAALGVTPAVFWTELVNPTWTEGSTTGIGYHRLLTARIQEFLAARGAPAEREAIAPAVSRFSDRYFRSFHVDPLWRGFLQTCIRRPGPAAVVATDHYAEATEAIVGSLADLEIPARSLGGVIPPSPERTVGVANSADLGAPKSSREFWLAVRRSLGNRDRTGVFLVDDFGCNEPEGDAYGEREKVERRRLETEERLRDVFGAPVTSFPFLLPAGTATPAAEPAAARIAEALGALERFLAA